MENKIMEIVFDTIKDINFYNYDNDKKLQNVAVGIYEDMWGNEKFIDIMLPNETYTLRITKSYQGLEKELIDNVGN